MNGEALRRPHVAVVVANPENARLLAAELGRWYDVGFAIDTAGGTVGEGPFDLCIVDERTLFEHKATIESLRLRAEPLLLPVLLLTHGSGAPADARDVVDDVLRRPVDRPELRARVEALLRSRAMSLRLRRTAQLYRRERRIAERMQAAAMPHGFPAIPGYRFDGHYTAASDESLVGGDWYDVLRLADGRLVVTIGDVAGAGLEAAVTMAAVRQVLRGVAHVHADPAMMLDAADRSLQSDAPERVVTAFVAVICPVTREFSYASAGHPAPLVRRSDGTLEELDARGVPLGVTTRGRRITETVTLGECTVFYTDGLIEYSRDVVEGEERLHDAVARGAFFGRSNPAQALYQTLVEDGAHDDVAVLMLQHDRVAADRTILRWTFDTSDVASARETQRAFSDALARAGLEPDAIANAEVVYAELVGNIVRYAPGAAEVALDLGGALPVLHVLDRGRGFRRAPRLPADLLSENGRGLFIIDRLTEEFSASARRDGGSHARAVLAVRGGSLEAGDSGTAMLGFDAPTLALDLAM